MLGYFFQKQSQEESDGLIFWMVPTQSIAQKHFFFENFAGKMRKQWDSHQEWVLEQLQWHSHKDSLQQVSDYVQLFENEKLAVRKFLKQQRLSLKGERRPISE